MQALRRVKAERLRPLLTMPLCGRRTRSGRWLTADTSLTGLRAAECFKTKDDKQKMTLEP